MAGVNEGDVIEGIFTIGLGLYIADGRVDKQKLNQIRTKIDPQIFKGGRVKYNIVKDQVRSRPGKPPDIFNVDIEIRLKYESVNEAYGENFNVLYKSSKDIGNINSKIDQLVTQINNSNFSRRVRGAVDYFLNNNVGEIVNFLIIADGIAGESSGGAVKGDVTLQVWAVQKGGSKKIIEGSLPFSLKSESVTVANLSPYKGMLNLAAAMDIRWDAATKYERLAKPFNGPVEQAAKFKMIVAMYEDLKKEIKEKSKSTSFTKTALEFLGESIFGSDLADVVDIQRGTVKEITVEYFDKLKSTVTLMVEDKGNNLVFTDKNTRSPIFQIRTKLRPPPKNEAKFYLEVGKGIYAK